MVAETYERVVSVSFHLVIVNVFFSVENLLATGEGGQTFEPAKFKLLLHHRKLELQAQVLTMMVVMNYYDDSDGDDDDGDGGGDDDGDGSDDDGDLVVAVEASGQGRAADQGEEGEATPDCHREQTCLRR